MNILLHLCCAPCATYPASALTEQGHSVSGIFFNPNIHPIDEFNLRKKNVEIYSNLKNMKVFYFDDFLELQWREFTGNTDERCLMCYDMRMEKTAKFARENNYDAFSTSLLVSPFQKHDIIKSLGEKYAKKYGINFYYKDFREGYWKGKQMAKEMNLYRQKYCGCIRSI